MALWRSVLSIPVSTVILQGDGINTAMEPSLANEAANIFLRLPTFEELIVAENVPFPYLVSLSYKETQLISNVRYVSLYACVAEFFEQSLCTMFPKLEELTIELVDMPSLELEDCHQLKRLWIRGYPSFADAASNANASNFSLSSRISILYVLNRLATIGSAR